MKSITIIQPNASLLVIGAITEIRSSRYTAYRGAIAVYASPSFHVINRLQLRDSPFLSALSKHYDAEDLAIGELPTGQILGFGQLADCFDDVGGGDGTFVNTPYIWKFSDMRILAEPIRHKCDGGLADLPVKITARLEVFA